MEDQSGGYIEDLGWVVETVKCRIWKASGAGRLRPQCLTLDLISRELGWASAVVKWRGALRSTQSQSSQVAMIPGDRFNEQFSDENDCSNWKRIRIYWVKRNGWVRFYGNTLDFKDIWTRHPLHTFITFLLGERMRSSVGDGGETENRPSAVTSRFVL